MKIKFLFTVCFALMLFFSAGAQVSYDSQLPELFAGEWKIFSLNDTINPIDGQFTAIVVSGGKAVYTTYKVGQYEANALWGYDTEEKMVYSVETQSNGLVWIHKGNFDEKGVLTLKRFSRDKEPVLLQETIMEWIKPDKILSTVRSLDKHNTWHQMQFYFVR